MSIKSFKKIILLLFFSVYCPQLNAMGQKNAEQPDAEMSTDIKNKLNELNSDLDNAAKEFAKLNLSLKPNDMKQTFRNGLKFFTKCLDSYSDSNSKFNEYIKKDKKSSMAKNIIQLQDKMASIVAKLQHFLENFPTESDHHADLHEDLLHYWNEAFNPANH